MRFFMDCRSRLFRPPGREMGGLLRKKEAGLVRRGDCRKRTHLRMGIRRRDAHAELSEQLSGIKDDAGRVTEDRC